DRQQGVGGADVARRCHRWGEQDGGGGIGVERQPRLAGRSDREGADLDAVLERGPPERGLCLRIAQRERSIRGELQADLNSVEADLARERDLGDVAALPE